MKNHKIESFEQLYLKSIRDPEWFWDAVSKDIGIIWDADYNVVCDSSAGKMWTKWFVDGKLNIANSTVSKFAKKTPHKVAYHFVSEDGTTNSANYLELESQVNKLANALRLLSVKKGDVVAIYMPMILETVVAMLACAKVGAIQTVIFSGFSIDALKVRLLDSGAKILFITDGFFRKGRPVSQKIGQNIIDQTAIQKIIIVPYKKVDNYSYDNNIVNYCNLLEGQPENFKAESMQSEDPLFILYTSGTTGKPKGVIQTHGGFAVFAGHQAKFLIDLKPEDVLLWPADLGWITGQVWNAYGLLEVGATAVIYDGAIDWPNPNRLWELVEKYKVSIFGTSPTAARMYRKMGIEPQEFDLDSVRLIPTTGEPIDEKSWYWLFDKVGRKKIPIVNLAGGTEIGGAMLSVFMHLSLKPTTVGIACPGFDLDVYDESGNSVKNKKGFLVVKSTWPAMSRGLLYDNALYEATYWSKFKDVWFHGDYVLVDDDGLWYMHGRVDDIVNVSGHRLSTAEVEHQICRHSLVLEAAVTSIPDEITGEALILFVVLKTPQNDQSIKDELKKYVAEKIGPIAKPKHVFIISDMPKTRTGKIMRRLLKAKLLGTPIGDVSSLENPHVLQEIDVLNHN